MCKMYFLNLKIHSSINAKPLSLSLHSLMPLDLYWIYLIHVFLTFMFFSSLSLEFKLRIFSTLTFKLLILCLAVQQIFFFYPLNLKIPFKAFLYVKFLSLFFKLCLFFFHSILLFTIVSILYKLNVL